MSPSSTTTSPRRPSSSPRTIAGLSRHRRSARRDRRSRRRRRRAGHPRPHPREAAARLPGARQAGAVREAADHRCRDLARGRQARGRAGQAADPGRLHAPVRPRVRRSSRRCCDSGELGRALVLHCAHRNPAVPPSFDSAMVVRDSLVHEVDVTRFLFDEEIASIQIIKPPRNPAAPEGLADPQIAILRTASGRHVDVELFVTTGVGLRGAHRGRGREGQRDDRTGRRPGAQDAPTAPGAGRSRPASGSASAQAYDTEFQRWVDAVHGGRATGDYTDGPTRLGRLRRVRGVRGRRRVAQQRAAPSTVDDGRPRVRSRGRDREDRPGSHTVPPRLRAARIPARGGRTRLRVPAADPAPATSSRSSTTRGPTTTWWRKFRKALRGRGRRHRLGAAGAALVRTRRGRARGGGAQLEARHPDHRRPGRQRHQHRVLRPAREGRGIRAGVLPVHGGAGADLRARGHRRPHRSAPRRLRRGRPGGGADHPRASTPPTSAWSTSPATAFHMGGAT